jgi:hypothetical protein
MSRGSYDWTKEYPHNKVRKRKSYSAYGQLAKELQDKGISPAALSYTIDLVHDIRAHQSALFFHYRYSLNRHHAEQSIKLLKEDLNL